MDANAKDFDSEIGESVKTSDINRCCVSEMHRRGAHSADENGGNASMNPATNLKVLFVGDSSVGKSCIIWRYTEGKFVEDIPPTIGVDFKIKSVDSAGRKFNLNIWDTAGQEKFRSLMNSYYRGAHGIIMVYDVSRPETLQHIQDVWMEEISMFSTNEKAVKLLLGNKIDTERKVTTIHAAKFARENGFLFAECSSKEGLGIVEAFDLLIHRMIEDPEIWGGANQQTTRLVASDIADEAQAQRSRCSSYYCSI